MIFPNFKFVKFSFFKFITCKIRRKSISRLLQAIRCYILIVEYACIRLVAFSVFLSYFFLSQKINNNKSSSNSFVVVLYLLESFNLFRQPQTLTVIDFPLRTMRNPEQTMRYLEICCERFGTNYEKSGTNYEIFGRI